MKSGKIKIFFIRRSQLDGAGVGPQGETNADYTIKENNIHVPMTEMGQKPVVQNRQRCAGLFRENSGLYDQQSHEDL